MANPDRQRDAEAAANRFTLLKFLRGFRFAALGLAHLWRDQVNFRFHLGAAVLVVGLGIGLGIARADWLALAAAIGLVLVAEAMNSALEYLADASAPDWRPLVGKAKDTAAAGVLLAALTAAAIGLVVFVPPLFRLLGL